MSAKQETLNYASPRVFWSGSHTSGGQDIFFACGLMGLTAIALYLGWLPLRGGPFQVWFTTAVIIASIGTCIWFIYSGVMRRSTQSEINEDGIRINGKLWPWSRVTNVWGRYAGSEDLTTLLGGRGEDSEVQILFSMNGPPQSFRLFSQVVLTGTLPETRFRELMGQLEEFLRINYPGVRVERDPASGKVSPQNTATNPERLLRAYRSDDPTRHSGPRECEREPGLGRIRRLARKLSQRAGRGQPGAIPTLQALPTAQSPDIRAASLALPKRGPVPVPKGRIAQPVEYLAHAYRKA